MRRLLLAAALPRAACTQEVDTPVVETEAVEPGE